MKNLFFVIFLLSLCGISFGQVYTRPTTPVKEPTSKCSIGLENAPELRRMKLGMSITDVEKTVGKKLELQEDETAIYDIETAKRETRKVGVMKFSEDKPKSLLLEGVSKISLSFYENQLFDIDMFYLKEYVQWKDNEEFVVFLSSKFNLPKEAWRISSNLSTIACDGFNLSVNAEKYGSSIYLTNLVVFSEIQNKGRKIIKDEKTKQKQVEEDKKKNFKP